MKPLVESQVCFLQSIRESRGLSQAELARRCGLTRQAVHVIESGRSVPSVLTAFKLAEGIGCALEEIFPRPSTDKSIPVQLPRHVRMTTPRLDLARVRSHWVGFPVDQPENANQGFRLADAILQRGNPHALAKPLKPREDLERNFVVVGCDPGLGVLRDQLATIARPGRMLWFSASSQESLKQLEEGQSHVAGIHFVGGDGDENLRRATRLKLKRGGVLMRFAHWEIGWMVAVGNPKGINGVEDLSGKNVTFINREKGSGSRYLFDVLLRKAGVPPEAIKGYEKLATSHNDGGIRVCRGEADVAMGLRSVAMIHGLDFIPIAQVGFDLVIPTEHMEHPGVASLCETLQSWRLRRELQAIPGYQTSETGRILAELPAQ
jgi:putative molybdopterin biosynthesis protein